MESDAGGKARPGVQVAEVSGGQGQQAEVSRGNAGGGCLEVESGARGEAVPKKWKVPRCRKGKSRGGSGRPREVGGGGGGEG